MWSIGIVNFFPRGCVDADTEAVHAAEVSDRVRPKAPNPTLRKLSVGVQNILVQHALSPLPENKPRLHRCTDPFAFRSD